MEALFQLKGETVFYGAELGKAVQNGTLNKISDYLLVNNYGFQPLRQSEAPSEPFVCSLLSVSR